MIRTSDLRLAIMPTGSVVCMRRTPMQDVGTCPMTEATYRMDHRRLIRIHELVVCLKFSGGSEVLVLCFCWL
jgi:hypothetical protein